MGSISEQIPAAETERMMKIQEVMLAATPLVECEIGGGPPRVVQSVAEKLKSRLNSSVPLIYALT